MFVNLKYLVLIVFVMLPLMVSSNNVRKRRRPMTIETTGEAVQMKSEVPDQIALASHPDAEHLMAPIYTTDDRNSESVLARYMIEQPSQQAQTSNNNDFGSENFKFLNSAMNVIKAEDMAQYTSASDDKQLDEARTAQEYVEKAMQLFGGKMVSSTSVRTPTYQIYENTSEQEDTAPNKEETALPTGSSVTRSYDVLDFGGGEYVKNQYEPKYQYHTAKLQAPRHHFEKIQSSSGELPKAEILKQIEKSVIKYMKELEAEGKLTTPEPTTPPSPPPPPKVYYKFQSVESTEAPQVQPRHKPVVKTQFRSHIPKQTNPIKFSSYHDEVPYPSEAENSIHDPTQEFNQNVEFVYKFRSRPNAAASQKQPAKTPFDHSSALKTIQGFDLSHAVNQNERPNKQKLFFNSDTYHDINSLPYKPEKVISRPPTEYKKPKESSTSEYHGYGGYPQSSEDSKFVAVNEQYIASSTEKDSEDDGYPIMNPYQYVLKKEPSNTYHKFSESSLHTSQSHQQPSNWTPYAPDKENSFGQTYVPAQKGLEFDSYSPKYNHNPEGYGYQHTFKNAENAKFSNRPTKRGKRGGLGPHGKKNNRGIVAKDYEANVALRPPKI